MGSYTQNIVVNTNGLGEVVKVDVPPPDQSSTYTYSYYRRVYFRPNNGARIGKSTAVVQSQGSSGSPSTGNPTSAIYTPKFNDSDKSLWGCWAIGIEYSYSFQDTWGTYWYEETHTYTINGSANQVSLDRIGGDEEGSTERIFQYEYYVSKDS
jgi:hypothetical protein